MIKQSFLILLHTGFWLGYTLLVLVVMFVVTREVDVQPGDVGYYVAFVMGVAFVPTVLSFYLHYVYLFRNYLQKQQVTLSVVNSGLLNLLAVGAGYLFLLVSSTEAITCVSKEPTYAFFFTFSLSVFFGIIGVVVKGFLTWFEELKLKEELVEKNHAMELALIKSQLDPHFLFNTINNIDVLIAKRPEEASRYLNKLSDIMRFMLYETKSEEIPLARELEYIEKYIHLQRIRTANQDFVRYEVQGRATGKKIVPMLFLPFIENAFKHASNKKLDHAVDIAIQMDERGIRLVCQNKFDPHKRQQQAFSGLGNALIKRRLQLLYPEQHELQVELQEKVYRVELNIRYDAA